MSRRALAAVLVLLAACGRGQPAPAVGACRPTMFEGQHFTLCSATPDRHAIVLRDADAIGRPYRRFTALPPEAGRRVAFAMNAGMFDDAGRPIGLLVEDGRERHALNQRSGAGNFHLEPNGVFYGDRAGWHIATTAVFAAQPPTDIAFASQSGPMLLMDSRINRAFIPDGASRYIRNGVGIDPQGTAWFAISDEPVSFGRFARLFHRLGCAQALYFDGAVSSLWDPAGNRQDDGHLLGPIVVVVANR